MDDIFFEAHVENLKRELNVSPDIVIGEEARKRVSKYGRLSGGMYIWEENLVALLHNKQIDSLAHEMRHAWQHNNNYRLVRSNSKCSKMWYNITYIFNMLEVGANRYALNYCVKSGLKKEARERKQIMLMLNICRVVSSVFLIGFMTCLFGVLLLFFK